MEQGAGYTGLCWQQGRYTAINNIVLEGGDRLHEYFHQWAIRTLMLALASALYLFALPFGQVSAGSPPSMPSDSSACERAEDCFQAAAMPKERSEEHTSELQSQSNLVCRL